MYLLELKPESYKLIVIILSILTMKFNRTDFRTNEYKMFPLKGDGHYPRHLLSFQVGSHHVSSPTLPDKIWQFEFAGTIGVKLTAIRIQEIS